MTDALRVCRQVGHGVPRHFNQASTSTEASTNREPCMKNGGSVSSPISMPKYVEPQMIHTEATAGTTNELRPDDIGLIRPPIP